jgi:hypothetical protein
MMLVYKLVGPRFLNRCYRRKVFEARVPWVRYLESV